MFSNYIEKFNSNGGKLRSELALFRVSSHPVSAYTSNAIGSSLESNPSRRIFNLDVVKLGHVAAHYLKNECESGEGSQNWLRKWQQQSIVSILRYFYRACSKAILSSQKKLLTLLSPTAPAPQTLPTVDTPIVLPAKLTPESSCTTSELTQAEDRESWRKRSLRYFAKLLNVYKLKPHMSISNRHIGVVIKDITISTEGLRFNSWPGQIGPSVASSSPPLLPNCVSLAPIRGDGPPLVTCFGVVSRT